MATTEFAHFEGLCERLAALGADPFAAMAPFVEPFDAFHVRTAPADWLEGLVKAYVGDGLAADFYREIATFLDADTRTIIVESLADAGQSAFVVDRVRAAIAADPRVGGRLALWGRRLMGEALSQAQRVAAERDALTALLAGGVGPAGHGPRRDRPAVHPADREPLQAHGGAGPVRLGPSRSARSGVDRADLTGRRRVPISTYASLSVGTRTLRPLLSERTSTCRHRPAPPTRPSRPRRWTAASPARARGWCSARRS